MTIEFNLLHDPTVLRQINNAAVPEVNELDEAIAGWLVANAALAGQVMLDGRPAGVIVVLDDRAGYGSEYYGWFTDRYRRFLYVDRVIVAAWARGQGLATHLYREVDRLAEKEGLAIAADVYSDPPNLPSLKFHAKMGYQEVGQQFSDHEGKTVAKLLKYPERVAVLPK